MCPIWPLHLVLLYLLAICPLWVLCQQLPQISAVFNPDSAMIHMNLYEDVNVTVKGVGLLENDEILVTTENAGISFAEINSTSKLTQEDADSGEWHGKIRIYGEFLGRTNIGIRAARNGEISAANETVSVIVTRPERVIDTIFTASIALFVRRTNIGIRVARNGDTSAANETVSVIVTRPERVIDTIFTASIALFVSLIFINFGCAMHWPTVKEVLKKPIGPVIGMVGQFIFMPLMTFGLGFLIFPDNAALHLGMFMTGVAPGGGASNIWTFILGGNLNLSLAMTSISTIFSFGFMPLWIFSLGQVVFANANIGVPYTNVITFVVGLLVPMSIGLAMQRFTPKIAAFMVKILKGFSSTLLIFIIVFAIVTNLYIFQLFTWQIVVAGMGIPWLGYMFGYALARIFKRPHKDALAISIETGIQNTGIAIFLLRYALSQPEADITTVIPVSAAIMTPIPMTAILIYQKIKGCIVARRNRHKKIVEDPVTPVYEVGQPDGITTIDGNLK